MTKELIFYYHGPVHGLPLALLRHVNNELAESNKMIIKKLGTALISINNLVVAAKYHETNRDVANNATRQLRPHRII